MSIAQLERIERIAVVYLILVLLWGVAKMFSEQLFTYGAPLTLPYLFGHKTVAFFDLWALQHFSTGIITGWCMATLLKPIRMWMPKKELFRVCLYTIAIAYVWELFELKLEVATFSGPIAFWKDGFEHWTNRFIADPMLFLFGAVIARNYPRTLFASLPFACLFMYANSIQPTCMTIQEGIFGPSTSRIFSIPYYIGP